MGKKVEQEPCPPPIAVYKDQNDGTKYVVDGNHRATVAKQQGKLVPARIIDDDNYKIKGTNILTLVIAMIFGVRNEKR